MNVTISKICGRRFIALSSNSDIETKSSVQRRSHYELELATLAIKGKLKHENGELPDRREKNKRSTSNPTSKDEARR
jgi:hypothetical protein